MGANRWLRMSAPAPFFLLGAHGGALRRLGHRLPPIFPTSDFSCGGLLQPFNRGAKRGVLLLYVVRERQQIADRCPYRPRVPRVTDVIQPFEADLEDLIQQFWGGRDQSMRLLPGSLRMSVRLVARGSERAQAFDFLARRL